MTKTSGSILTVLLLNAPIFASAADQAVDLAATETSGERLTLETAISKALVFETVSSTTESLLFMAFYGTATTGLGTFFAASLLSSTAVYIAHDYAWDAWNRGSIPASDPWLIAAKATSYRLVTLMRSFTIGSLLGGATEWATSAGFALAFAIADTALYVGNEWWFAASDEPSQTIAEPFSIPPPAANP